MKTAKALEYLNNGDIKTAYLCFALDKNIHGLAYCNFLLNKLEISKSLLITIKNSSPAVNWLLALIDTLTDEENYTPTYFQIRNFYEPDLNMLFKYQNYELLKKICGKITYLSNYNKEIFKYTARVFIDNGLYDKSVFLLKRSIDFYYKDPESHFMLAEVYQKQGNIKLAQKEYTKSNESAFPYYPAIKKLKEINSCSH